MTPERGLARLLARRVVREASYDAGRWVCPTIKRTDPVVIGMPSVPPDSGTLPKPGVMEPDRKGKTKSKSFPLLNHTVNRGMGAKGDTEQRCQDEVNTSLIRALRELPEDH